MKWHAVKGGPTKKWARWRWPVRISFVLILIIVILSLPLACTTTIMPPAQPTQQVTVYLLDHGHTPSLVLPSNDDTMTRYVYGDWNYYALGNREFADAFVALFWPTGGTLGRQQLDRSPSAESLRRQVGVEVESIYPLQIEGAKVNRLKSELDSAFDAHHDSRFVRVANDMEFRPYPQSYTYFHNSNHVTASWLKKLGCRVDGPAFSSRWQVSLEP